MNKYITLSLLLAAGVASADLSAIKTLTPEMGQEVRRPIEAQVFGQSQDKLPALEAELLEIFKAKDTSLEGKQYTCRMLRHCASDASVSVLVTELLNPELSHWVRFVIQEIDSPSVDAALIAALPQASDLIKPGIIDSLGKRGTTSSVKAIAPYLKSSSSEIQQTSIIALGNIGGKDALDALSKAKVKPEYVRDLKEAQMQAAGNMDSGSALKIYGKFMEDGDDEIRCAALVGLTSITPDKAVPAVLTNLDSQNKRIQNTAIGLLTKLPPSSLASSLPQLSPAHQVLVIHALAEREAVEAEAAILALASSENSAVSKAAKQALASVGTLTSAEVLISKSTADKDAFASLCALKADGVDTALLTALKTCEDDRMAAKLIECLAERQAPEALPYFIELAEGDWNRRSAAALSGMSKLVSEKDFETYAQLMLKADNDKKVKAIEKSMVSAVQYQRDTEACAATLAAAYPKAEGESKYAIIRTLGAMGGPEAERILNEARENTDPKTKDAAIRGLCNSPNPAVAEELLNIAETSDNNTYKVLALRGYIRLANIQNDGAVFIPMCKKAAALTDRPAELKSIIACAKRAKSPEAIELVATFLDNPELVNDCGWAIIEMSWKWESRAAAIEPLKKLITLTNDDNLKTYALDRIKTLESQL